MIQQGNPFLFASKFVLNNDVKYRKQISHYADWLSAPLRLEAYWSTVDTK